MKHLAFIPARSGSKGIKFKNRRLPKHTINFLSISRWIDDVIVPTDDEYIEKKIVDTNYIYLPRKKNTLTIKLMHLKRRWIYLEKC